MKKKRRKMHKRGHTNERHFTIEQNKDRQDLNENENEKEKEKKDETDDKESSNTKEDDDVKAPFIDYCPHVFRYLRTCVYGISDREYLSSMRQGADEKHIEDIVAKFSEGRSGAFFFYSLDAKYIIKTVTKREAQTLLDLLRPYKEYMQSHPNTYLNKFLGLHALKIYQSQLYFVVLANVFLPNPPPHEIYDLKGSWVDRLTNYNVDLGLFSYIYIYTY
ncbi:phosphatidylinositol-4-phosphate 5-kinase its3, partial [Reticulomyxa filosa]